ncbi:tyrosine-type recombinase/integrase, partial [Nonomuraea sp. NPDC001023]
MALLRPLMASRKPSDLLLQRADGRSFDRWRQQTALRRAARAAGLDVAKLTPHMLRATAATLLLAMGVPVEKVQALLGHASPVTTQRYDRGETQLDGHAVHRLAQLLTQQLSPGLDPGPGRAADAPFANPDLAQPHELRSNDFHSPADSAQQEPVPAAQAGEPPPVAPVSVPPFTDTAAAAAAQSHVS